MSKIIDHKKFLLLFAYDANSYKIFFNLKLT